MVTELKNKDKENESNRVNDEASNGILKDKQKTENDLYPDKDDLDSVVIENKRELDDIQEESCENEHGENNVGDDIAADERSDNCMATPDLGQNRRTKSCPNAAIPQNGLENHNGGTLNVGILNVGALNGGAVNGGEVNGGAVNGGSVRGVVCDNGSSHHLTVEDVVEGKVVAMEMKRSLTDLSSCGEENEDVPRYLPREFRSKRGVEIGSENLITNDDLLLAATLVADARSGQSHDLKTEPRFVRSYNLYKSKSMRFTLYAAIMVNLFLALFEEPAHESILFPFWVTMIAEAVCLAIFTFRLCHHSYWRLPDSFKRDAKNITAIVCIIVTVLDMIAYILVLRFSDWKPIRWSRVLRPLLIMNFSDGTHLRRAWSNIRLTLHEIIHVIVLFYFLIVVFALVAWKMFQKRTDLKFPDGDDYFKTYTESFWVLYVLVTTANNPDVMLPAYDSNRLNFIFFTVYIILCLYLMLNILLAVTYNSFRENMKIQIRQSSRQKTRSLNQAFEVIKINVHGREMVTYKTWSRLIRLAHPKKTKYQIDLLMMVLDTDKTGYISRDQFLSVADLLNVPISQVSERKTFMEIHFPKLYLSKPSKSLRKIVSTIYFSLFYDGVVLINVILICIDFNLLEWGFFVAYFFEILLKWYTNGTKRYFGKLQHWSDVIITLLSLLVLIITNTDLATSGQINPEYLSVVNVFRIFRILRCLIEFQRFRIIFDCVINVSFSIFTYCGILFIVFYAFAIVGMEVFNSKIRYLGYGGINGSYPTTLEENCGNMELLDSAFTQSRYCNVNFNDLFSSFFVLASLLIVNNWHSYCLVSGKASRIYFMFFHLCVAVVVMNIVTAFILDMFMHEYTFTKKGNIDTKVEMTIKKLKLGMDDETGEDIIERKTDHGRQHEGTRASVFRRMTVKQRSTGEDITEQKTEHRRQHEGSRASVFRRMTVKQRPTPRPNLSRYDGIRFHIKQRSWTKTELLLEQLFAVEEEGKEENEINTIS